MKLEFQYAIELQLFDDRIIFNYYVAVAALLQFSVNKLINFCASDDVIYCWLSEVFDSFSDGNLQHKLDLSN